MIRSLDTFIVVAEEKNLLRASARLHLSQSALTRSIQTLEEKLDVRLFDRTGRGVELTHAGQAWLEHARKIRESVTQATQEIRRIDKGQVGQIEIGVLASAMFGIVPEILNQFAAAHPEVEMVLHNVPRAQQLESLRKGQSMLSLMPFHMGETDLEFELLDREPLMLVLHESHPMATRQEIHFAELRDMTLIGMPSSHRMPPTIRALLDRYGFEFRMSQKSDNVVSSIGLVRCNLGVAVVPASLQALQVPSVVYRPLLTDNEVFWDVYCIYRKQERSPVLHALLETARQFNRNTFARG